MEIQAERRLVFERLRSFELERLQLRAERIRREALQREREVMQRGRRVWKDGGWRRQDGQVCWRKVKELETVVEE